MPGGTQRHTTRRRTSFFFLSFFPKMLRGDRVVESPQKALVTAQPSVGLFFSCVPSAQSIGNAFQLPPFLFDAKKKKKRQLVGRYATTARAPAPPARPPFRPRVAL